MREKRERVRERERGGEAERVGEERGKGSEGEIERGREIRI